MSFELFNFVPDSIDEILEKNIAPLLKVKALSELLGKQCLPDYLINYMENFCPAGPASIAVHGPKSIAGYADKPGEIDKKTITRTKGFIGDPQLEKVRIPTPSTTSSSSITDSEGPECSTNTKETFVS